MQCNLNNVLGYSPDCEAGHCVYWRDDSGTKGPDTGACALDRFGLIGRHPDDLTYLLMRYKHAHRAIGTRKMLAAQRKRWLVLR